MTAGLNSAAAQTAAPSLLGRQARSDQGRYPLKTVNLSSLPADQIEARCRVLKPKCWTGYPARRASL